MPEVAQVFIIRVKPTDIAGTVTRLLRHRVRRVWIVGPPTIDGGWPAALEATRLDFGGLVPPHAGDLAACIGQITAGAHAFVVIESIDSGVRTVERLVVLATAAGIQVIVLDA